MGLWGLTLFGYLVYPEISTNLINKGWDRKYFRISHVWEQNHFHRGQRLFLKFELQSSWSNKCLIPILVAKCEVLSQRYSGNNQYKWVHILDSTKCSLHSRIYCLCMGMHKSFADLFLSKPQNVEQELYWKDQDGHKDGHHFTMNLWNAEC